MHYLTSAIIKDISILFSAPFLLAKLLCYNMFKQYGSPPQNYRILIGPIPIDRL